MNVLSEVTGDPFHYSGISLWERFTESFQNHADKLALVCTHQPRGHLNLPNTDLDEDDFRQNPYLRLKYRHLAGAVNQFADALLKRGVRPGTPIFAFLPNMVECNMAYWASCKLGCTWVPINSKNLLNSAEALHMINTALSWKSSTDAVFLVDDASTADRLEKLAIDCNSVRIIISSEKRQGWNNFEDVFKSVAPLDSLCTRHYGDDSLIMFTSGTTSMPKGAASSTDRFACIAEQMCSKNTYTPDDVVCVILPNNHSMGMILTNLTQITAGTVVFPGSSFNPQIMLDTLISESCTRTAMVPTMVHALSNLRPSKDSKPSTLKKLTLGGSMVNLHVIDKCFTELGAEQVENVWGMTEGCASSMDDGSIYDYIDGDVAAIGSVLPGSKLRVCAPNSKAPLPSGVLGELHWSAPSLIENYIGLQTDDFYRDEDSSLWFITGDQARVDQKGRIFLTGRYKEMIIRGGENIAPAAIEAVLMQNPATAHLNVQIVGAKDTIAGEVPVAVYQGRIDLEAAQNIQATVLDRIGPLHIPDQALSLEELGLSDFPRTMAGKIQKSKLATLIQDLRDKEEARSTPDGDRSKTELAQIIKSVWKRALGYEIDEHLPFDSFADSITVLRTRDMIAKAIGKQIPLKDMISAQNIAGQIEVLQQNAGRSVTSKPKKSRREGPVTANDVVIFRHQPSAFAKSKSFIETILMKYGLAWNDVADIMPAYDYGSATNKTGIMDSWTLTTATTTTIKDLHKVRTALRKALANNPIMSSLLVWNDLLFQTDAALHIVMQQTNDYLDARIHDLGPVSTVQDMHALTEAYPIQNASIIPGPMFDACLVFVEETQTVAIIMKMHHAMVDASSATIFQDDLNDALAETPLSSHTDYKIWSDSYYSLRTSLEAQASTKYHIKRLRDISAHRKAIWTNTYPRARESSLSASFEASSLLNLRHKHPEIAAPTVLKTAYTLMSTTRSQHTHAVFANQQACRDSFPFIPPALSDLGHDYTATDVAGPTVQTVINLIAVQPDESVLSFLHRMQTDQDNLTKHASAPLQSIMNSLDPKDSPLVLETLQLSLFNWVPGFGSRSTSQHSHMKHVSLATDPELAFSMNCGLGGEKGDTLMMEFIGTGLTRKEYRDVAGMMEMITLWLVDERNWGRRVGEFVECLDR